MLLYTGNVIPDHIVCINKLDHNFMTKVSLMGLTYKLHHLSAHTKYTHIIVILIMKIVTLTKRFWCWYSFKVLSFLILYKLICLVLWPTENCAVMKISVARKFRYTWTKLNVVTFLMLTSVIQQHLSRLVSLRK